MSSYVQEALAFDENFIAAPDQVTLRDKILFLGLLCFSFVFVSWPIETTIANLQGLTHSSHPKQPTYESSLLGVR